ncbi:hypothetical protein [Legionella saoudiensis]|uniref:hypothetical protein n=1 Tax=Legionella saoudiensis TaxID=1750561 RepID=UPI000730A48F|nr:hypothetical protein [Legionella saoudiensis]
MNELKFFKNFKQTFDALENQASAEDLIQMRQIRAQLHAELDKYKEWVSHSFDSLWDKRNQYNQLLADNINYSQLSPEQYKQVTKQFKQLDCDINALSDFLKEINPEVTLTSYEKKLKSINEQIHTLEQTASCTL